MSESVIFALRSGDQVLCEWRDFNGNMQHCIPGGSIESCDRKQENYILAAARREAEEELGVVLRKWETVGNFESDSITFHVILVNRWSGELSPVNRDNQNRLSWVSVDDLTEKIAIPALKRIIEEFRNID